EQTGEQSSQQVTNRLDTVTVTGTVRANQVQEINLTVKKAPGAEDINLDNVTIQWNGPDGVTTLTSENVNDADGDFNVTTIKDADGSAPVLNDPDDRIDVGINASFIAETSALEEGETVTLTIVTQSGGSSEVRIQVPESLSGEEAVEL
ncbi:MAG: flagellin, partial [Halobacteriaceae archaeon]